MPKVLHGTEGTLPDGSDPHGASNGAVCEIVSDQSLELDGSTYYDFDQLAADELVSKLVDEPMQVESATIQTNTAHDKQQLALRAYIRKMMLAEIGAPSLSEDSLVERYSIVNPQYWATDNYISRVVSEAVKQSKKSLTPTGTLLSDEDTLFAPNKMTITIAANQILDPQSPADLTAKLNDLSDSIVAILKLNPSIMQHRIFFPFHYGRMSHWCLAELGFSTTTATVTGTDEIKTHIDQINYLQVYDSLQSVPRTEQIKNILNPMLERHMFDAEDLHYNIVLVPVKHQNDGLTCGIIVAAWLQEIINCGKIQIRKSAGEYTQAEKLEMRMQQLELVNDPSFTQAQIDNLNDYRCTDKVAANDTIKHLQQVLTTYLSQLEDPAKIEFEQIAKQFLITDLLLTKINVAAAYTAEDFGYDPDLAEICALKLKALNVEPNAVQPATGLDQQDRENTSKLRGWFSNHEAELIENGIRDAFFTDIDSKGVKTDALLWRQQKSLTAAVNNLKTSELPFEYKDGRECLVEVLSRIYLPDDQQLKSELEQHKAHEQWLVKKAVKRSVVQKSVKRSLTIRTDLANGLDVDDYRDDFRLLPEDDEMDEPVPKKHADAKASTAQLIPQAVYIDERTYFLMATCVGREILGAIKEAILIGDEKVEYVGELANLKRVGSGVEARFLPALGIQTMFMGFRDGTGALLAGTVKCFLGEEFRFGTDVLRVYCEGNIENRQLNGSVLVRLIRWPGNATELNIGNVEFEQGIPKMPAKYNPSLISTELFSAFLTYCNLNKGNLIFSLAYPKNDLTLQQFWRNSFLSKFFAQQEEQVVTQTSSLSGKELYELRKAATEILYLKNATRKIRPVEVNQTDLIDKSKRIKRSITF